MDPSASDDEVIARVLSGEVDAFTVLFERYKRYVARILGRYLSPPEVEDALVEVFMRAYTKLSACDSPQSFRHWIAAIAVRRAYDMLRLRKKRAEVLAPQAVSENQDWIESVLSGAAKQKFSEDEDQRLAGQVLSWALDQLSPEMRMVITLVHFEERSYQDAAKLLGWSVVNVRVRALRARKALRSILTKAGYE